MYIGKLQEIVSHSNEIVFFGGAGVSTESGIPDFRSVDGLYSQRFDYPPETILSHSFFISKPADFYKFYKEKMFATEAKPNKAHLKLAELEQHGKLSAVITQNIDGLHQTAGSKNVLELHGSVLRNYCMSCKKAYSGEYVLQAEGVPYCECGGIVKPDVVLYGESLDNDVMQKSLEYISNADMLIIGGTSLAVYPAAGLINYYKGDKLVLINKSKTPMDSRANVVINGSIGEILDNVIVI